MAAIWSFDGLAGRRVLVTGASSGIGAAVAQAFADCRCKVVLHYHRNDLAACAAVEAIRAAGGEAWAEQADLAYAGAAADLIARAGERLHGLDILVNNAGDLIDRQPATGMDDALFRRLVDLNFTSVFEMCRAARPVLAQAGAGVIINTTSIAARNGGGPGGGVYAAAKAAVSTLTRALAKELAPDGIRVNAVSPGFVRTSIHERLTSEAAMETMRQAIPLQRIAEPEDCVGAYLFLAENRLSGYITGQIIEVNGGMLMP